MQAKQMSGLLRWLTQLAKRNQARPELFEALLTGRYYGYAYLRLRFLAPRIILRLLTQVFEVFVLSSVLPWEYFVPLLSYRASSALIGGSYWGALEQLRDRVRDEVRRRRYESARVAIEAWLGISLLLALACIVGISLWARYSYDPTGEEGFSLFDAYAVACFLRLAMELVVRTYHAGIFALTRVYRPLATILLPDLFELGFVILAWNRLGPWGLALSIVVAGGLRSFWTYHYARKAYQHSRVSRPRLLGAWRARRMLGRRDLTQSALHTVANGSSQVDSLLILSLAHATAPESTQIPLAVVYYLLRPLLSAGHSWTRAFYFDWKRLNNGVGRVFQARMRAMMLRIGLFVILVVGTALLLVGYLLWREHGLWSLAALLPLFVSRTAFSIEQLEAFSLGQYARLSRMGSVVVLAVVGLLLLRVGERELVLGAAAILLGSVLWSMRESRAYWPRDERSDSASFGLAACLVRLTAQPAPLQVFAMCVDRQVIGVQRMVRALEQCFPGHHVARAGRSHLIAFAPSARAPRRAEVVAAAGGALSELAVFDASSGGDAGAQLVANGWFERALSLDLSVASSTRAELVRDFRLQVPDGHVLELDVARGRIASVPLPWGARATVLREIASRASGRRPRHHARATFRVAVLASQARPEVVFVAPRDAPGFAEFLRRVEHASLRSALARS